VFHHNEIIIISRRSFNDKLSLQDIYSLINKSCLEGIHRERDNKTLYTNCLLDIYLPYWMLLLMMTLLVGLTGLKNKMTVAYTRRKEYFIV